MDIHQFLKRMRILINTGNRRFIVRRHDRFFYNILLEDFGITIEQAWIEIKTLNKHLMVIDYRPTYENSDAYVFKKLINNQMAYIKIKIEEKQSGGEELVCISFHKDML